VTEPRPQEHDDTPRTVDKGKEPELTTREVPRDQQAEVALRQQTRVALCPQIVKGEKLTGKQKKSRRLLLSAHANAKERYEQTETYCNRNPDDKRSEKLSNDQWKLQDDILKVIIFALDGDGEDKSVKTAMRRLAAVHNDTSQSINQVVERINDPQVRAYWDPKDLSEMP
jgi:hypothetical protein